jgi:hypothetical protein
MTYVASLRGVDRYTGDHSVDTLTSLRVAFATYFGTSIGGRTRSFRRGWTTCNE